MITLDRLIKDNYIDNSLVFVAKQRILNSDILNPSNYITKNVDSDDDFIDCIKSRELNTSLSHKIGKPIRFVARHLSFHFAKTFYSIAGITYHGAHTGYFAGKLIYNICNSKNYSEEVNLVKKSTKNFFIDLATCMDKFCTNFAVFSVVNYFRPEHYIDKISIINLVAFYSINILKLILASASKNFEVPDIENDPIKNEILNIKHCLGITFKSNYSSNKIVEATKLFLSQKNKDLIKKANLLNSHCNYSINQPTTLFKVLYIFKKELLKEQIIINLTYLKSKINKNTSSLFETTKHTNSSLTLDYQDQLYNYFKKNQILFNELSKDCDSIIDKYLLFFNKKSSFFNKLNLYLNLHLAPQQINSTAPSSLNLYIKQ